MKINKKILIAEDELLIAKVLRMQLEKLGFVVENVVHADEAFNKVKEMKPDVIILDVCLKNKTCGLEAGKKIREAGIKTPIIFTTGNSYANTLQLMSDIKYSTVLSKPVEFEHLLHLINRL
ncbi:MAG: response regulator [Bacteroidota bacterium]